MSHLPTHDQYLSLVLAEARRQKMTPKRLSSRSGLAYSAAHKLLTGSSRRPTLESFLLLVHAVGWTVRLSPARKP